MLKKIKESIADHQETNIKIENVLKQFETYQQTQMLDALETVKNAGENGILASDWVKAVKRLHPEDNLNVVDLIKTVIRNFGFVIKRISDKTYKWVEDVNSLNDDPEMMSMISGQVELGKIAVDSMKQLGEFSKEELGASIANKTGMPVTQAVSYADHVMQQFMGGMLEKVSANRYKVKTEPVKTSLDYIEDLKALLKNAGLDPSA